MFKSEARHHSTHVRMARPFGSAEVVGARLEELAAAEQLISGQAGANPNDRDAAGSEPPEGNLANPFPPGYGEDLLEDS